MNLFQHLRNFRRVFSAIAIVKTANTLHGSVSHGVSQVRQSISLIGSTRNAINQAANGLVRVARGITSICYWEHNGRLFPLSDMTHRRNDGLR